MNNFRRIFPVNAHPQALMALAGQPLLAPQYLNFVSKIEGVHDQATHDGWTHYAVCVSYRGILNATALVEYRTIDDENLVEIKHNGPLAQFHATFVMRAGEVDLNCNYLAKTQLIDWLVVKVLDRALSQVAEAMDRFALQHF